MPIGFNQPGIPFSAQGILQAPNASGVYAIYNAGWLYVGESDEIQRRLSQHLNDRTGCIMQRTPTGFIYELVEHHGSSNETHGGRWPGPQNAPRASRELLYDIYLDLKVIGAILT